MLYKAYKIPRIGEKPRWIIEDENGRMVNNNPTKDELRCLEQLSYEQLYFNKGGGVDFYYLLAFNEYWTKLLHVWRVPADFTEGGTLWIGINNNYTYNVENMKEYEITYKFKDIDMFK